MLMIEAIGVAYIYIKIASYVKRGITTIIKEFVLVYNIFSPFNRKYAADVRW